MAKYALEIKQSAQKELDALDDTLFTRIDRKILTLADNPGPPVQKAARVQDQWRIRIGDWRVLYIIDDAAKHILITHVAHRRAVYER